MYSLHAGEVYKPLLSESEIRIFNSIKREFPFLDICIWNSKWLNEFMIHQPGIFYTLIEVEKDAMESVFYFLQTKANNVFMDPSESLLARYAQSKDNIIITNLVTEAPTQKIDKVVSVTLEKMLVDVFCNSIIFSAQQGHEMEVIFQTAFDKYIVDQAKMMRYAGRRGKRPELQNHVNSLINDG